MAEDFASPGTATLVSRPALFPGFCIDGSQPTDGEGVVDTGIDLVGNYHVYVSQRLGRQIGQLFGMVDRIDLDREVAKNAEQRRLIQALEGDLEELRPIADSIARFSQREGVEV